MTFFEKILHTLQIAIETPKPFGAYHLCATVIVIALCVLACLKLRNAPDKVLRRVFFAVWLVLLVGEALKQLIFSMSVQDGVAVWAYPWYIFPLQLCSSPLYILPLAAFLPDGKLRDSCLSFLATFSLFGGLIVMIYPGDVFMSKLIVNVQTMLHHGSQLVIGILLAVHNRHRYTRRFFARGIPVFLALLSLALIADIVAYPLMVKADALHHAFNMFYISPYFDCTLPVLSGIYKAVPYPVFLAVYILGFLLAAFLIFLVQRGILILTQKRHAAKVS